MLRRILLSSRYTGLSRVLTKPQFTRTIAPTCSSVSAIHINRSYSRHTRSGEEKMVAIASYEDVKAAGGNDNVLIIDVREPNELEETGKIPASINVPLKTVGETLKIMSANDFKAKFGRDKPSLDTPIIFTCRSGRRSLAALKIAESLGYTNLKNFDGGWLLWEEKSKKKF